MKVVDLRSDTVTKPTPDMRRAMAEAEVGDDVSGEDPTVNRLEEMAAERLGKASAMFVPSGTMGNLVSLLSHCGRGEAVILGDKAHIYTSEQIGAAQLGGIGLHTVPNQPDGKIRLEDIEGAIQPENIHFPVTRVIALENTHNICCGSPLDLEYMESVGDLAGQYGLKLHLDGARIFNASAALGVPAKKLAQAADSISFCLSKGLAAPVGSMVCGSDEFVAKARRYRKVLGGGMRQAGVLAAPGIVALTGMTDRLSLDHSNARKLAGGLAEIDGIVINPDRIKTNILFFELSRKEHTLEIISEKLKSHGVLMGPKPPRSFRAVTHCHISPENIDYTLEVMKKVMR